MKRFHVYWISGRVIPGYVVYDQEQFTPSDKPVMISSGLATMADAFRVIEDYLVDQTFDVLPIAGSGQACIRHRLSGVLLSSPTAGVSYPFVIGKIAAAALVRLFLREPEKMARLLGPHSI